MNFGRVGVIGAGNIGRRHLRVIRDLTNISPIAISRRPDALRELESEGYGTAASIREAANQGVALCVVATETGHHTGDASAAIEAGCDVLVEKPLGVDVADALRASRTAASFGRSLNVGCVLRFSDSLAHFRKMLPRIGAVHTVQISCQSYLPAWRAGRPLSNYYSAREDGGVMRDLIHEIDYAGWIFGWPDAVQARLRNTGRLGILEEEAAELRWEISKGPSVTVTLDFLTRPRRRTMIAFGDSGTLEWDGVRWTTTFFPADGSPDVAGFHESADDLLSIQDRTFIQAESRGDPRLATVDDALRALAICDSARRASQSGRAERIQYA